MPIVWEFPDGHLELTTLAEDFLAASQQSDEEKAEAVLRLAKEVAKKAPHLQAATPHLVKQKDVPTDRATRNHWRLVDGVIVEA